MKIDANFISFSGYSKTLEEHVDHLHVFNALKNWEKCLPHVVFAYNRSVHSTTSYSPFEVVYDFNPLTPLDILPFPSNEYANFDGKKKADSIKELHAKV